MKIITRFAPSPTGFLHIGGARTALFNYLFAKKNGGEFLLRIEDTDQKRSTPEAVEAILEGLSWLGLKNDGEIVFQSKNIQRHKEVALDLLRQGKAYYCHTSAEELASLRQEAETKGEVFRFKSPWRDKIAPESEGVKPVIRLKSPNQGQTIINDLIRGEITIDNSELDDLVILRSDETPTYMLAVVVDDFDMKISHIIRGEDHLTNSFRQQTIYDAMNWQVPKFAHVPLIHGPDGAKMSKRHGATSVIDYNEMGYLPEAMRNYLLRLGWSHGDDEIISDEQALEWFNLDHIGKSPARFDFAKLDNLNKHYIKEKSEEELFDLIKLPFSLTGEGEVEFLPNQKNKIIKALKFVKERAVKLIDLSEASSIYIEGFTKNLDEKDSEIIKNNQTIILELKEVLEKITSWNHDSIKEEINNFAAAKNLKFKDFGKPLRIALTFSSSSAGGIFDVLEILEKEESLRRINFILSL
ncbi:MAG: glutamyl-tRNA synthetase [Rickettsiales bacterium]|jgi:glutamyl-tRNA synthetase